MRKAVTKSECARKARKGDSYLLEVEDDSTTGHVGYEVSLKDKDKAGYEPIIADIGVKKGVIITGKILDAVTKKSLPGIARAAPLSDNPFVNKYPSSKSLFHHAYTGVAADGTFRLVSLPGPVVVMGGPDSSRWQEGQFRYKPAAPDPKYPRYFIMAEGPLGKTPMGHFWGGDLFLLDDNYCRVLVLKPDVAVVTHDIIVEPATALLVRIQDADGRPLAGTRVTGIGPLDFYQPVQVNTDTCSAFHLKSGKPRLMVFFEPTKNLVGTLRLKGEEKEPATVKLGQPGKLKGRLLDEGGRPMARVVVDLLFPDRTAAEIHGEIYRATVVETDADGRFEFNSVIPDLKFSLWWTQGKRRFEPVTKIERLSVEAGAVLDFGDIKLKLRAEE